MQISETNAKEITMFRLLFVGLLTVLWLSLEEVNCQYFEKDVTMTTLCYNTSSGKTCFTTFIGKGRRKPFEAARHLCNATVPGSSLIRINSLEGQRAAEIFIGRQESLANETIIMDARKLEARDSVEWAWVNGHPSVPKNLSNETILGLDAACVESKHGQSPIYCTTTQQSQNSYICENSDSKSTYSYRHNTSYYFASEVRATWYDARNECLLFGGDLASITDVNMTGNWSWLNKNEKYWIGLHRNKWIWNSTGAALTYTNWKGGYPDEAAPENKCICIDPKCRSENSGTICDFDRKWNTCKCDQNYAVVCQKEENFDTTTLESVVTEVTHQSNITSGESEILFVPSANATSTSTKISIASIITTTSTKPSIASTSIITTSSTIPSITCKLTSITTTSTKPSIESTSIPTTSSSKTATPTTKIETTGTSFTKTDIAPATSRSTADSETPSTGLSLFQSFSKKEILIAVLLLVTVVFIIGAVILFIRKRKHDRRNETSPMGDTKQDEAVTEYATVVPGNKPTEVTTPAASPTYAEVQMTQNPKPTSNPNAEVTSNPTPSNITYAAVQMAQQPAPSNTTYADVTPNPTPSDITYAEVTKQPAHSNNTYAEVEMSQQPTPSNETYAEVTQRPEPSNNHIYANFQPTTNETAEMDRGVVYAGLEFPHPNGKAVEEPIYLQAMDVKPEAESGEDDVATQDLGPVYAEPMKLKKSD